MELAHFEQDSQNECFRAGREFTFLSLQSPQQSSRVGAASVDEGCDRG